MSLTLSSIKLDDNDDCVACDRILEICNLLGRNGVKRQFHGKSLKSVVLMVRTISLAENDDSETRDSVL